MIAKDIWRSDIEFGAGSRRFDGGLWWRSDCERWSLVLFVGNFVVSSIPRRFPVSPQYTELLLVQHYSQSRSPALKSVVVPLCQDIDFHFWSDSKHDLERANFLNSSLSPKHWVSSCHINPKSSASSSLLKARCASEPTLHDGQMTGAEAKILGDIIRRQVDAHQMATFGAPLAEVCRWSIWHVVLLG